MAAGEITLTPFDEEHVNPNSVDLCLADEFLRYTTSPIDPRYEAECETLRIDNEGYLMEAGAFLLGASREVVGSQHFVPIIHGKSSTARAGLFVHVTADLIDIGSIGNVTFQLYATLPIRLFAGMRIAQVTFWRPFGEIKLYDGKYKNSQGPRKSEIHRDPFWRS